jgi:hypothetical protein
MTYADGEIIKGVWDNGEYSGIWIKKTPETFIPRV